MEREKEALKEWAKVNGSEGFARQDKKSGWLKKEEQDYLHEWNFDSVPDVNALLDQLQLAKTDPEVFGEIRKTVLVSIMKGNMQDQKKTDKQTAKEISLPEYIYVF